MTSPADAAPGDSLEAAPPPVEPSSTNTSLDSSADDGLERSDHRELAQDSTSEDGSSRPLDDGSAAAPPPGSDARQDGDARRDRDGDRDDGDRARAHTRATAPEVVAAICPYLASAGGSWRMAEPSRDHRCLGLTPPTPQPPEKQRRHCLVAEHVDCTIYRAAREARATALAGAVDPARIAIADARRRPVPRTAPVLLEPPRLLDQATRFQLDRTPGQLALVGLMVIAFAFVALSRLSGGTAGPTDSPSASASLIAILPSASRVAPSPKASVRPSPSASGHPSPSPSFRTTYTVKKGDTLASIATRFKTTAAAIRTLNNLTSAALRVGQVLKIP